ncbi:MAG: 16S rRNA (cytidine(1402)-2'-O)-methyltransferase [Acutalibacteraceae bacterium]|nr:16S rRNA (cytidine(1402)-2'-O)-methyltransferase [Acutalibacteraceae bacterium]
MAGKLFVVGTPIGNLSDFSPRAIETLSAVDFIAAEDTRVTIKLLNRFEINTPMVSYHKFNSRDRGEEICQRIENGENCAIVTDAGMPCVSDPGELLVQQCYERGITVCVVPGPTALASALAISGLSTSRFTFEGFLSVNKPSRREHLSSLLQETRTMVFYEAPHKLPATLKDMYRFFGNRRISIVKELTKVHEEVIRTTLKEAAEKYTDEKSIKGEIVLIVEGAAEVRKENSTLEEAVAIAEELLETGLSAAEAAKESAKLTGLKKGDIYKSLLNKK